MTDGPDELLRAMLDGDTPGPEATPEQEAFVSRLLAGLRDDDPGMPDDVVRRLDAVLAEERRSSADAARAAGGPALALVDGAPDADRAAAALPDNVSVLPQRSASRGPSSRSFKLVTGIAAATVLVAGAAVVSRGVLGGSSSDSSGGAAVAAALIQDSGTAYSSRDLDTQAQQLVGRAYSADSEGTAATATPRSGAEETPVPPVASASATAPAAAPLTATSLAGCVGELTEGAGGTPLLVDQGSYDGRAAIVIVLPAADEAQYVDVWVVAAGCDTGSAVVLDFRRLPAP